MNLRDITGIGMTMVVIAIIFSIGAIILDEFAGNTGSIAPQQISIKVQPTTSENCVSKYIMLGYDEENTKELCNRMVGTATTTEQAEEVQQPVEEPIDTFSRVIDSTDFLSSIGTIAGVAVLLGTIIMAFTVRRF